MFAVIRWELFRRKAYTFWWTLGITGLIAVNILSYLAVKDQADQFNSEFGDFSNSAGAFLGSNDLFSPVGYLSSQIYFIMLPILLLIMILTLVSSLMNRDENDTTLELTLARPISRRRLLVAKAVTGLLIAGVMMVVSYGAALASVSIAGLDISWQNLLLTHVLSFAFSLSFGVIMFTLIAMGGVSKRIAGFGAIFASFGGYILSSLASYVDQLKDLVKIVPYHYYDTESLLRGNVESGLIVYLVGVTIAGIVVSAIVYNRRDIG